MAPVFRAVFGYCFLIVMVRLTGRRPGKQMTPFELVLIFFMGGCTLTAMVGDERSVRNAFVQIVSIALTHLLITWARENRPLSAKTLSQVRYAILERNGGISIVKNNG